MRLFKKTKTRDNTMDSACAPAAPVNPSCKVCGCIVSWIVAQRISTEQLDADHGVFWDEVGHDNYCLLCRPPYDVVRLDGKGVPHYFINDPKDPLVEVTPGGRKIRARKTTRPRR